VNPADLEAFAHRDWARLARHKQARWLERVRTMSAAACIALGDDLRAQVKTVRPDWPTRESRARDRAAHVRLSELLRAAAVGR
jgi:hypothetical protein